MDKPILDIKEIKRRPKVPKITADKVSRADLLTDSLVEAVDVPQGEGCGDCFFSVCKGGTRGIKDNRAEMCMKYACTPLTRTDKRNVRFIKKSKKGGRDVEK